MGKTVLPADEPLTLRLIRCTVTPRDGFEDIPLIAGTNLRQVELTETVLSGFADPKLDS